ncbi:MAG: hypothetical protein Fur0032_13940 [Terrimicrobiaceae bacterium]
MALEALAAADSGATVHERAVASEKAARMRSRIDPAELAAAMTGELMGWAPRYSDKQRRVLRASREKIRPYAAARDVLRATLDMEIGWRDNDGEWIEWWAAVDAASADNLCETGTRLAGLIESLWNEFLGRSVLHGERDEMGFYAGITDGLIGDEKPRGVRPARFVHKKVRVGRAKKPSTRQFSLHPYEVGHAAGCMSRLKLPETTIRAFLQSAAQMLPASGE